MEKSPSLKAVRRHLKSVEVMPEKFNVPVILEQLDNKSATVFYALNMCALFEMYENTHRTERKVVLIINLSDTTLAS